MAIRNHWKKILLALFATMWAGCENEAATNAMPEYGCGPCGCDGNGCEVVPDYGAPYDPEDSSIYAPLYGVSVPDDSMVDLLVFYLESSGMLRRSSTSAML